MPARTVPTPICALSRATVAKAAGAVFAVAALALPSAVLSRLQSDALRPAFDITATMAGAGAGTGAPALRASFGPEPPTALRGPKGADPVLRAQVTGATAIAHIRAQEGLSLEAYRGPGGHTLIGYGHKTDLPLGTRITRGEAERLLAADLARMEAAVRAAVKVPVTDKQFSAMVALAYNIGPNAFARSTVVHRLNAGDRAGAAEAFLLWTKLRRDGVLVESDHLKARRRAERALFLAGPA